MVLRKLFLLFALAAVTSTTLQAQHQPGFDPAYQFVESGNLVQDKNFYLLTLLEEEPTLRQPLEQNKTLQQFCKRQLQQVNKLADSCTSAACLGTPLLFDSNEIKTSVLPWSGCIKHSRRFAPPCSSI